MGSRLGIVVACVGALLLLPATAAAERHGFVEFPKDEHPHYDGWDYWWGAGDLFTESGHRYTLGMAYTSWDGHGFSGYQLIPRQGPYQGQAVLTVEGPAEWGHPEQTPGSAPNVLHRMTVPGVDSLLRLDALDTQHGLKVLDRWERTSLSAPSYHLAIDQDQAKVHPSGRRVRLGADLRATMRTPPLLAGGSGQWWYGIPQTYDYPSRSFQYMQSASAISGTLEVGQPDGSVLRERVRPGPSSFLVTHEYDASPEDIPAGLGVAEASQWHARYPQYYSLDWPWELTFVDLRNGAQLMLAVLHFDDTDQGILRPLTPGQPTNQVLATLRLADGRSVPLDDGVNVEHLSYRRFDPIGASSAGDGLRSLWTQAWEFRVSYHGTKAPAFDLGLVPQWARDEPGADDRGARLAQRVAYAAEGSYGGCPVRGFGWSELLVNWYAREDQDPFFTGGERPPVPAACGDRPAMPPGTPLHPQPEPATPPTLSTEACSVVNPGPQTTCEYDATRPGGVGGHAEAPGGWTITIRRPGLPEPIVMRSHGGNEAYPCGTVQAGDHVAVSAEPGAYIYAGDPLICL